LRTKVRKKLYTFNCAGPERGNIGKVKGGSREEPWK
jgi:hypothetical protein